MMQVLGGGTGLDDGFGLVDCMVSFGRVRAQLLYGLGPRDWHRRLISTVRFNVVLVHYVSY